jgi:hypothetical protein
VPAGSHHLDLEVEGFVTVSVLQFFVELIKKA